ncbi:hypothetical protein GCM10010276_08930 [Streptomyces longisporus]|uniref:Uncharacterized protein n=1 Tax=Streptomyces longisporus TaxID=1948 RepID=A0ABN3L1D7_STRLO
MPLARSDAPGADPARLDAPDRAVREALPAQEPAPHRRTGQLAHACACTEPPNVFVIMTEDGSADWSLGDGAAQHLDGAGP